MEFRHESGIYICTCTADGKSYIGQSNDVVLRKYKHVSDLRRGNHFNPYMQASYDEYGEDSFEWNVLEYCSIDKLNEREHYWIETLGTIKHGFNSLDGGSCNRSFVRTDEFKQSLSEKLRQSWENDPERRERFSHNMSGENNPMYGRYGSLNPAYGKDRSGEKGGMFGKHHTEHANELNRIAHTGANNKMSKPVVCIETGEIFPSMGEAGRQKDCDDTTINKCCRGVKKTAGGYHWKYATEEEI